MKILLWIGLITLPLSAWTQRKSTYLQLAYMGGQITQPGISLKISQSFKQKSIQKANGKIHLHELTAGLKVGGYHHFHMQTGLFVAPELAWLQTRHRGGQIGVSLASGYLRTLIPDNFTVDHEGQVARSGFSGNNRFMIMPGIRFGKKLKNSQGMPQAWYIQPNTMWQFGGFNERTLYFLLEAGLIFHLSTSN